MCLYDLILFKAIHVYENSSSALLVELCHCQMHKVTHQQLSTTNFAVSIHRLDKITCVSVSGKLYYLVVGELGFVDKPSGQVIIWE